MRIKTKALLTLMYDKGLKTGDIVRSSGLARATVSAIRGGKGCTYETAIKIAKALGVKLTDIAEE